MMVGSIQSKVERSMEAAASLYYRLVLLVGEAGTGKTAVLRAVANSLNTEVININLALSAELLEVTASKRPLRLPQLLEEVTYSPQSSLVLDNLEILFDKDLKQDPLRLLQGIARNRPVIASWNGTASKGKLVYAEVGHPEYRSYEIHDVLVVGMDGTSTIASDAD